MERRSCTVVLRSGEAATIKDLGPEDAAPLYQCLSSFSEASLRVFRAQPFTYAEAKALAAQAADPAHLRVIALLGDQGAGYASLSWGGASSAYPMLSIGIADLFQGKGLGRKMMQHLLERARERDASGVDLWVFKENWRALRLYASLGFRLTGETADQRQHTMRLHFEQPQEALRLRGVQVWLGRWRCPPFTVEAWTFAEWERYLQLLQGCGANTVVVYLWPRLYYLPGEARTQANEWLWRVLGRVTEYAGTLGLRMQIAFSALAVPGHLWSSQEEQRAQGEDFLCPMLCWGRGRHQIAPFWREMVERFSPLGVEFCVWIADVGWCSCRWCAPTPAMVARVLEALRRIAEERAPLHVGLGTRAVELLEGQAAQQELARTLAREMQPGELLFVNGGGESIVRAGREAGLSMVRVWQGEDAGPEELLLRPAAAEAGEMVERTAREGWEGVCCTRTSPRTQFVRDAHLAWRAMDPLGEAADVAARLASLLRLYGGAEGNFREGLERLEQWWANAHLADLEQGARCFVQLGKEAWVAPLKDSVKVLLALASATAAGPVQETACAAAVQQAITSALWAEAYAPAPTGGRGTAASLLAEHVRIWLAYLQRAVAG